MDYIGRSQDVSEVLAVDEIIHNQPTAIEEEKIIHHNTHVEEIGVRSSKSCGIWTAALIESVCFLSIW